MKTILPALLLLFLVSCSHPPPATFEPFGPAAQQEKPAPAPMVVAPPAAPVPEIAESVPTTNAPIPLIDTNAIAAQRAARIAAQQVTGPGTVPSQPTPTPFPSATAAQTNAPAGPGPGPAPVQPATATVSEDTIPAGTISFPATPLDQVLQVYSELVNRTVLRAANLTAPPITLTTRTALTKKEAIQAFDAVLALNGVAMINVGDKFVKAVPIAQANNEGAPLQYTNDISAMPELGQYVTHIVQLKYVKPTVMQSTLQGFAKNPAALLAVDDSQILVIRDYAENVKRMLEMINQIDVPVQSEFVSEVIPIKYARADEIADALNSLSSGGGGTTTVGGSTSGPGRGGLAGQARPGASPFGQRGSAFGQQIGYQPGYTPQATGAPTPANASFTQRLRSIIDQAGGAGQMQILGQTKIIADERTNSLLIFATRQDMDMIKNIVSKLDVVLAQVLIETIIMDVSLNNGWNFGVSGAQGPKKFSSNPTTIGAGAFNNGQPFLDLINGVATNAFSLGGLPGGFTYWAQIGKAFNLALQAGASDNRVNVIQKPQILTSHAKPGSIFIGSTVPYITTAYYGGFGNVPSSSYQQLRVGIGLTVTPYINPDGLVVMQIDESIDEISGSTHLDNVGDVPNTTSRTISAEVAVRDGDAIMLGGFIRNSSNKTHSGVPLLKDIPLLGALFSNQSTTKERKELIVLMRPTVLRTPEIAAMASTQEKKKLPGVTSAESEVQADEKKLMKSEQKKTFDRESPVTPEEQKAYGRP